MESYPTRNHPLSATLSKRTLLNPDSPDGITFHLEITLPETMEPFYRPGDAIGILPENSTQEVSEILKLLSLTGQEVLPSGVSTYEFFSKRANLRTPSKKLATVATSIARRAGELLTLLEDPIQWSNWTHCHCVKYFLRSFECHHLPLDLLESLFTPLLPRLYSIASSPSVTPQQIHLTIALVKYTTERDGEKQEHLGVCSNYLYQLPIGSSISLYLHPTKEFLLPSSPAPIIMIAAGTGIAPFRSFILHQEYGTLPLQPQWLLFGEKRTAHDFFYQEELAPFVANETLIIDTAFSRDNAHKYYVQDRLYEKKELFWKLFNQGATLYICGSADKLGKGVEATLIKMITEEHSIPEPEALLVLRQWRKEHRYKRDLY
jgi:sulfite reductase (NADPH) flavoprotein alpha-component